MKTLPRVSAALAFAAAAWLGAERGAAAQDIEVPILVIEQPDGDTGETDDELDLANLVTSAAKGVTTVQEAPAIITILPNEEIRERQPKAIEDLLDGVPGFLKYSAMHGQFPFAATRGVLQSMLYLRDGISQSDTFGSVPTIGRITPIETIKRIEIISGPGGVLWGANSFLGLINVITKDAEDIDGIEASIGYGDGQGDKQVLRGYVMAGDPELFGHDDWKLMVHASYERYIGPVYTKPSHMFSTPLPHPNSPFIYGPIQDSDQSASTIYNFDGKLTFGNFNFYWFIPFPDRHFGVGFPGSIATGDLPEDYVTDAMGNPECTPLPTAQDALNTTDRCIDRQRASREDVLNWYERYLAGEWKTRFSSKAGLSVKGFFVDIKRELDPIMILMPIPGLLEGGLTFKAYPEIYRAGMSVDGDVEFTDSFRMLYGAEAFHEWMPDKRGLSRQGRGGAVAEFLAPYNPNLLPFACPRDGSTYTPMGFPSAPAPIPGCPVIFIFQTSRTTVGGFTALQFKPSSKLILDGGVRLQAAPELTSDARGYGLSPTFGASAVYEFIPDWHVKLNYAQGFRPPVFNNTDSNGEGVEIDGDRNLEVERSTSYQAEVNARLLKGKKRIRELSLRADYSYTTLENFITFVGGRYSNVGDRGIHSAEFLAKLYLKGDHRVELGWTWVDIATADKGSFYSMPEHWFNVAGVATMVPDKFQVIGLLKIYGAMEDPNRRVEARDLQFEPMYGSADPGQCYGCPGVATPQTVIVEPYELVVDRLPPAAELQIGFRWFPTEKLQVQATAYNTFNNKHYSLDAFNDWAPRLEILPHEYEAFRFFASATYNF